MMSTPNSATFGSRAVAARSVPSGVNARGWIWYITPRVTHSADGRVSRSLSGVGVAAETHAASANRLAMPISVRFTVLSFRIAISIRPL
jgi:hypothetical protein